MKTGLDKLTIQGFKSIRDLTDFPMERLNLLVGCNGAGKSNFMDFFCMLSAMSIEGLSTFIEQKGGADGFFFNGPKETPQIVAHMSFGDNKYGFVLLPSSNNVGVMVKEEVLMYIPSGKWEVVGGGKTESALKSWGNLQAKHDAYLSAKNHVYEAVSNWTVYHFHDTSSFSPMRRYWSVRDNKRLNPDASNIAAFLLYIRAKNPASYQHIIETIKLVAPFFDDFILEPETKGQNEVVRLEWRQKGSRFPFQPWQFSDGTMRFICLATALLQPEERIPSAILIDEPELGLHPFALDVLAGLMLQASQKTQLIVSTQSPSLLNHFEPPNIIVVDRNAGQSTFTRLQKDAFADWLKDYSLGELWQKNIFDGGPAHE